MSLHSMLEPIDREIDRRDNHLDFLRRQLAGAYDRADYVRAEALSTDITKARDERQEIQQSRDTIATIIESIEDDMRARGWA